MTQPTVEASSIHDFLISEFSDHTINPVLFLDDSGRDTYVSQVVVPQGSKHVAVIIYDDDEFRVRFAPWNDEMRFEYSDPDSLQEAAYHIYDRAANMPWPTAPRIYYPLDGAERVNKPFG